MRAVGVLPWQQSNLIKEKHDETANLYVADATLLPRSLGNPPILTIIALAKRVGQVCTKVWS